MDFIEEKKIDVQVWNYSIIAFNIKEKKIIDVILINSYTLQNEFTEPYSLKDLAKELGVESVRFNWQVNWSANMGGRWGTFLYPLQPLG